MRLIDADALIQSLEKKHAHWHELVPEENKGIEFAHSYALNVIRNAPSAEPTGDLIKREDAIKAVTIAALDDRDELEALEALPSAEAVSMEEHIKELNDLAVEWKAKFAKAEKITDEIYDETMAKVAKECEECKERLRNIRPSAEAESDDLVIKGAKGIQDGLYNIKDGKLFKYKANGGTVRTYPIVPSADAVEVDRTSEWVAVRREEYEDLIAEAVQGWIPCSERLPLASGEFLVTLVDHDGAWVSTAQWNMTFGGRWQDIFPNDGYRDISNVVAWKTLPIPYKGGDK